jgi:hypothetical protein
MMKINKTNMQMSSEINQRNGRTITSNLLGLYSKLMQGDEEYK